MIKEIYEQPRAIADTLAQNFRNAEQIVQQLDLQKLRMIYFTGSGTSYHACLASNYALSTLTTIFSSSLPASEFTSWMKQTQPPETVLIAISQSGESADVITAVNSAKHAGMRVVAVTNAPHSSLARSTELRLISKAAEERAVTATKSFVATLTAAYVLILELARNVRGALPRNLEDLENQLRHVPDQVQETIQRGDDNARALASEFKEKEYFFVLGSGPNYPTALEGALKLKESCNLYAEGFATREFIHGPMQLVDNRTPVFILQAPGEDEQARRLAESFVRFGAPTVVICPRDRGISSESRNLFQIVPDFPEVFCPLIYVVPMQLFAYYSSVIRGLNPDRPAKLRKVVK